MLRWEVSLRKIPKRSRTVKLAVMMIGEDELSLIDAQKVYDALPELTQCVRDEFGVITKTARILVETQKPLINGCTVKTYSRWRPVFISLDMTVDQIRAKLQDPEPNPNSWLWVVVESERIIYLGTCMQDASDWLTEQGKDREAELAYVDKVFHWTMNGKHMPGFGYFVEEADAMKVPMSEGMVLEVIDAMDRATVDEDKPRYRKGQRRSKGMK